MADGRMLKKVIYKKKNIPLWVKKKIIERDNFTCQICSKVGEEDESGFAIEYVRTGDYDRSWMRQIRFEIDHIIPEFRGGQNTEDNLQLVCRGCNRSKGYRQCI